MNNARIWDQAEVHDGQARPTRYNEIQDLKMPKERKSVQINEADIHSPSRTEKYADKHKKDVKNFVDTRITQEKTWTGQETKEHHDSLERPS